MSERIERYRMVLIAMAAATFLGMMPRPTPAASSTIAPEPQGKKVQRPTPPPQAQHLAQSIQPPVQIQAPPSNTQLLPSSELDVIAYRIDAQIIPDTNTLKATSTVVFQLVKPAQSAVFELNGSLKVSAVRSWDNKPLQYLQDTLDLYTVKVDLGQTTPANQQQMITFEYSGELTSAEGGPLPDKRLAYVGSEGAYLHYSSRWFPFHEYGADRATSEINLTIPTSWKLAAHSDRPITAVPGTVAGTSVYTLVETTPVLPGTLAAGPYIVVPVESNGFTVEYYAHPGSEGTAAKFAEETAQILGFYQKTFGPYAFGTRYVVVQTDDESLDTLAGTGIEFMSNDMLHNGAEVPVSDLAREVALQWFGQAVGLKSFDSAWLSYGVAQFGAMLYEQSNEPDSVFNGTLADISERALAYENDVAIVQAPAQLNDQTPGFRSIVFYKGAYVLHMLKNVLGEQKFFALMRDFYAKNRGKNVVIADFEKATAAAAGQDMRWFFGLWVDSTGVPEFTWDYTVYKTGKGEWRVRGTLKQQLETFRMPVDVLITSSSGGEDRITLNFDGKAADFTASTKGRQPSLVVDPDRKLLRVSDTIRTAVVVRRGIQEMKRDNYIEAEAQFRDAIKLSPRSSWAWYNLGVLYMKQRNYAKAIEAFSSSLSGDMDPKWVEVWSYVYKGNAYDALGQRDRAVTEYNKAIENGDTQDGAQEAAQRYLGEAYKPPTQ
jgi:aminopeptidase N